MQNLAGRTLELWVLGHPRIVVDDAPIAGFVSSKAPALLFYLSLTGRPLARSTLAGLFWPETPEANARTNLRKALANLNESLRPWLASDRQTLAIDTSAPLWIDAVAFAERVEAAHRNHDMAQLAAALDQYDGDFLEGFVVRDAPEFETWALVQRDHFRRTAVDGLQTLIAFYHEQADYARSSGYARRLLQIEPWHEETHRLLIEQLARMGQRGSALAQFEICRQVLQDELGVDPAPETLALVACVRHSSPTLTPPPIPAQNGAPAAPAGPAPSSLPVQTTPFIGREQDLAAVLRRLADPACRLLTLVGPGGIGKSRLALEAAQRLVRQGQAAELFANGVALVDLAPVRTASGLIAAIAAALRFAFYDDAPPDRQLLDYLREKRLLLILDNIEHLPAGVELIAQILAAAPAVKILATTCESLHLHEAWFHPIDGLSYPSVERGLSAPLTEIAAYDAVRLFVQSVRRAQVGFSLEAERSHVVRICQLVEGMPLAIELAAAWWSTIPGATIVAEIEQGLDILTARYQNVPERHRSMRAVFEHAWRRLDAEARAVSVQLAIFRGGFTLAAASAVAGASLPILASVVERSLVHMVGHERYEIHDLLRQFIAEKAAEEPDRHAAVEARHAAHYLALLHSRRNALHGADQCAALATLRPDQENIHKAWAWAVRTHALPWVDVTGGTLFELYWLQSRYQEGLECFRLALAKLREDPAAAGSLLALVEARAGAFYAALGDVGAADTLLHSALRQARAGNALHELAFCLRHLSEVAGWHDPAAQPHALLEEALAISRALDDLEGIADALYRLAEMATYQGKFAEARRLAEASLDACRRLGRKDWIAYALDKMGFVAWCAGDYAVAAKSFEEGYALFVELGDRLGKALTLGGLGWTAWVEGGLQLQAALPRLERSLALCREIGHRRHASSRLGMMGQIANYLGRPEQAIRYCEEALALARAVDSPIFEALALNGLGDAARALGRPAEARAYLLAVLELARNKGMLAHHLETLVILADLLIQESTQVAATEAAAKRMEAARLLALVQEHPSCWQVVRARAMTLCRRLQSVSAVPCSLAGPVRPERLPEVVTELLVTAGA
jgi:DNA-binding SARP family transcriptional activator/predicted ATPase